MGIYMFNKSKTIFCDLDGTLVRHAKDPYLLTNPDYELEILPGTYDKFKEWDSKGYHIVITTGRKESMREATEKQLQKVGIFYNQLIMGFGGAVRYIIKDRKVNNEEDTAFAINLTRDEGISNVEL